MAALHSCGMESVIGLYISLRRFVYMLSLLKLELNVISYDEIWNTAVGFLATFPCTTIMLRPRTHFNYRRFMTKNYSRKLLRHDILTSKICFSYPNNNNELPIPYLYLAIVAVLTSSSAKQSHRMIGQLIAKLGKVAKEKSISAQGLRQRVAPLPKCFEQK